MQREDAIKMIENWKEWFLYKRMDIACKSFLPINLKYIFLKTAKDCGAIKGRFCADGSTMVYFNSIPRK